MEWIERRAALTGGVRRGRGRGGWWAHVVLAHDPDGELGQVPGVDELAQGGAAAPDREVLALLLGQVALVDQAWKSRQGE